MKKSDAQLLETYKLLGTPQEVKDALTTLSATGMGGRCFGGRIILSGYCCLHCDSDDPLNTCGDKAILAERKRKLREKVMSRLTDEERDALGL